MTSDARKLSELQYEQFQLQYFLQEKEVALDCVCRTVDEVNIIGDYISSMNEAIDFYRARIAKRTNGIHSFFEALEEMIFEYGPPIDDSMNNFIINCGSVAYVSEYIRDVFTNNL